MSSDQYKTLKTFGRRGGRPLSPRQHSLVDNLLPSIRPVIDADQLVDPKTWFEDASEVWLEIGFGGGEHSVGQAKRHPEIGMIGCEVFYEGIGKCLSQIADAEMKNFRLWDDDARLLMAGLSDHCLDRIFILFPDPWPKLRHQKRRIIQAEFLTEAARVLKPGGRLRFATDVRSYADEALEKCLAHPAFDWQAEQASDWREVPVDHIPTRYQAKNLGDIAPVYYDFIVG